MRVLRSPSAVSNLALLVLFPLTMASNTFVDPHTMPGWARAVLDANPVSRLVTAVRDAMAVRRFGEIFTPDHEDRQVGCGIRCPAL